MAHRTSSSKSNRQEDLVFALCHEVGNLVGAIRLNADLVDGESSPRALANVAVEIDDSSSRIRSLLALVRPLLRAGDAPGVGAEALLSGLADAIEETGGRGVHIEVGSGEGLPRVAGRLDALHHLLSSFVWYAVEEARPSGRVTVAAEAAPDGSVAFRVEDDGREERGLSDRTIAPTGRNLVLAVAEVVLERWAGDVRSVRDGATTRVELRLPPASPGPSLGSVS